MENCAFVYSGVCPNSAAVFQNNAVYKCQPYTGAFKFFIGMQALKYTEEFVGIAHIKTSAVIFNKIGNLIAGYFRTYFNDGFFFLIRVFYCI